MSLKGMHTRPQGTWLDFRIFLQIHSVMVPWMWNLKGGREGGRRERSWCGAAVIPGLLLFSHSVVSMSLWPHGLQTPGFPVLHYLLEFAQIYVHQTHSMMPSNHLILCLPFSSCLQSFPASESFLISWLFTPGANVLELQLQHQSFQWIFKVDFF